MANLIGRMHNLIKRIHQDHGRRVTEKQEPTNLTLDQEAICLLARRLCTILEEHNPGRPFVQCEEMLTMQPGPRRTDGLSRQRLYCPEHGWVRFVDSKNIMEACP